MYKEFYNFSEKPFDIVSNPKFLLLTPMYREALASLVYGIQERRGILSILGEVGTGKTTLLKAAIRQLKDTTECAFIFNTRTSFSEQLEMVLEEFKIMSPVMNISTFKLTKKLKKYAEFKAGKNKNVAILIDEAQNLNYEALESWRLLSNLETESGKLVQIIFSGQPEFEKKLKENRLRQLDQRIGIKKYIRTLSEEETFEYVKHRLKIAGGDENIFDDRSMELVWQYSKGVPRKINILCDNALLIGYALQQTEISEKIAREAIKDLDPDFFPESSEITEIPKTIESEPSVPKEKSDSKAPDSPEKGGGDIRFRLALGAGLFACVAIVAGIYFHFVL